MIKKNFILKSLILLVAVILLIIGAFILIENQHQAECRSKGGEWIQRGFHSGVIIDKAYCQISYPTSDGGKACTNNDQCESALCLAPEGIVSGPSSGTCYGGTVWPNGGCAYAIKNGIVVATQPCVF